MNVTQSFKLALKSLRTSKMRAFLTMLGIVIGVGDGRLGLTETDLKCIVREDRAGIYGE